LGAGVHSGSAFAEGLRTHGLAAFVAAGPNDRIFRVVIGPLPDDTAYQRTQSIVDRTRLVEADLEARHVSLKGFPLDAFVLPTRSTVAPTG
jgi:hypothetical protein